jgi:hypothetical protein
MPGIVDENADRPQLGFGLCRHSRHCVGIGHIGLDRNDASACRCDFASLGGTS